ncbi:MAG: hypothetical protein ACRD51_01955 [Candidatus Acidiferrum sp.]
MRSTGSNYHPWHLISVNPDPKGSLGRGGIMVIFILGLLILGLFAVLLVPQISKSFPIASKAPLETSGNPAQVNLADFSNGYAPSSNSALFGAANISFVNLVASSEMALFSE